MQCPHCSIHFHDNWDEKHFTRGSNGFGWAYRTAHCPSCDETIIEVGKYKWNQSASGYGYYGWSQIYPIGSNRGPVPPEVPAIVSGDYIEACRVLPISAKASAALARRCLQTILRAHGYKSSDLAKEIDLLLNETDPKKAIPSTLRVTIDGIRNFGNFSAHPVTDVTSLQIIDVEPHEAEWWLEILEEMFQHFYVRPAEAKARKAALDAKLKAAGKPPSK